MMVKAPTVSHCLECPTRRFCLAAGLGREALETLGECVSSSVPMRRGDLLYRAGDRADGCFVVRSGAYKTIAISADGGEYVTGFHFPGELFGMSGRTTGEHHDSAIALCTSTACRVQLSDMPVLWQIGSGESLLRLMAQAGRMSADDHVNLSQGSAAARVAGFLVMLARRMKQQGRDAATLPIPMSRTDLASYLGMTLECLSRVLTRLSHAGTIDAARNEITLRQPRALEALAAHLNF